MNRSTTKKFLYQMPWPFIGDDPEADPPAGEATFTPEQQVVFNKAIAKERKATEDKLRKEHDARLSSVKQELEGLKERSDLTEQEREELKGRLEQILGEKKTVEQKLTDRLTEMEKAHKGQLDKEQGNTKKYQELFREHLFQAAVSKATIDNGGLNPDVFEALLKDSYEITEILDGEGAGTGKFRPVVKKAVEKDGKITVVTLSVDEAIKAYADDEKYFNLFAAEGAGGAGATTRQAQRKGKRDPKTMSAKEYEEYRKTVLGL